MTLLSFILLCLCTFAFLFSPAAATADAQNVMPAIGILVFWRANAKLTHFCSHSALVIVVGLARRPSLRLVFAARGDSAERRRILFHILLRKVY